MKKLTALLIIGAMLCLTEYGPWLRALYALILLQYFLKGYPYEELRRFLAFALAITILLHSQVFEIKQVRLYSMEPAYQNGDWVFIDKLSHRIGLLLPTLQAELFAPGTVISLKVPGDKSPVIKRVHQVVAADQLGWVVLGDNPRKSRDSRIFGAVSYRSIRGRVFARF